MSDPEGASINDGICEFVCSLTYVTDSDAVQRMIQLGQCALLVKVDIKSAYRNVPIHPEDRWLMGMSWEGALYIDMTLPFSLRSAPKIFSAIADAAEWMVRQLGVHLVLHYLDDYLVTGALGSPECAITLRAMMSVFHRLGFSIACENVEGPTPCLEFLGFVLDSQALEVRLSQMKLSQQFTSGWTTRCAKGESWSLW